MIRKTEAHRVDHVLLDVYREEGEHEPDDQRFDQVHFVFRRQCHAADAALTALFVIWEAEDDSIRRICVDGGYRAVRAVRFEGGEGGKDQEVRRGEEEG